MSQYNSRIYVKVPNIELWKKINKEKIKEYNIDLYNNKDNIFISEGCLDEGEILDFVQTIADTIDDKCIVIADTTNINIEPYVYYVYYLGDKVKDASIYFDLHNEEADEMDEYFNINIDNVKDWLQKNKIKLNKKEKEVIAEEIFKQSYDFPIELVYTNLGDRLKNNEHLKLEQEVYLEKGEYNGKKAIEVFTKENKSIGYIDEYLSKDILQLMGKTNIKIKGIICKYEPLRQRSKNSKKALVSIRIV